MANREPPLVVDLSDLDSKRRLMAHIGTLKGLHEITIKARKLTRSLNANAYYFATCVSLFREWIDENWGERVTTEQAHETLKLAVLEVPRLEGIAIMPSTKSMDVAEFNDYLERVIQFLATKCEIVVPPSELYFEAPERGQRSRKPKTNAKRDNQAQG